MHALITPHLWMLLCPILLFPRHFGDSNWGRRLATLPPDHIASISHTDEVFSSSPQMKESISIPRIQCPVVRCFSPAILMGGYQCTSLPSAICIQNSDLAICLLLTHANECPEKTPANGANSVPTASSGVEYECRAKGSSRLWRIGC